MYDCFIWMICLYKNNLRIYSNYLFAEKESKELNSVKNAEDLGKFLLEKHLVENKKGKRKFVALLEKIGRNDMAVELEESLGIGQYLRCKCF